MDILSNRLGKDGLSRFEDCALELLCRKVASFSGDTRKALTLCKSLLEEQIATRKVITVKQASAKANELFDSNVVGYAEDMDYHSQVLLICLLWLKEFATRQDELIGTAVAAMDLLTKFGNELRRRKEDDTSAEDVFGVLLDELNATGIIELLNVAPVGLKSQDKIPSGRRMRTRTTTAGG